MTDTCNNKDTIIVLLIWHPLTTRKEQWMYWLKLLMLYTLRKLFNKTRLWSITILWDIDTFLQLYTVAFFYESTLRKVSNRGNGVLWGDYFCNCYWAVAFWILDNKKVVEKRWFNWLHIFLSPFNVTIIPVAPQKGYDLLSCGDKGAHLPLWST